MIVIMKLSLITAATSLLLNAPTVCAEIGRGAYEEQSASTIEETTALDDTPTGPAGSAVVTEIQDADTAHDENQTSKILIFVIAENSVVQAIIQCQLNCDKFQTDV